MLVVPLLYSKSGEWVPATCRDKDLCSLPIICLSHELVATFRDVVKRSRSVVWGSLGALAATRTTPRAAQMDVRVQALTAVPGSPGGKAGDGCLVPASHESRLISP